MSGEPPDPARASEVVARAVCQALQPGLVSLKQETGGSPLAVRVSTGPDNVSTQYTCTQYICTQYTCTPNCTRTHTVSLFVHVCICLYLFDCVLDFEK